MQILLFGKRIPVRAWLIIERNEAATIIENILRYFHLDLDIRVAISYGKEFEDKKPHMKMNELSRPTLIKTIC